MDTPIDITTITAKNWQPKIGTAGAVVLDAQDVDQCICTILATPKGADPLRPKFGFDGWQYLDWPINQSRPHLVREIVAALAWEPRIKVVSVVVSVAADGGYSALTALITWQFVDDANAASFISATTLGRST